MTTSKAIFHTTDGIHSVTIKLTWHKQLPGVYNGPSGYTVTEYAQDTYIGIYRNVDHARALAYAVRLYRKYERARTQRPS